jgi:hypothetical protein
MEQQTQGDAAPSMVGVGVEAAARAGEHTPAPEHPMLEDAIAQVQGGLDLKVQEIRDDRRLTPDQQRAQITDLWNRVSAVYPDIIKTYERVLAQDVETTENGLFYVIPSDRDSVRSAYNDLHDRVSFLREQGQFEEAREELERFAVRARRTGDRALRTAAGHLACELGEESLRDAWLSTSEEKQAAWNRLVEARKKEEHFKDPHENFWLKMTRPVTLKKPEEA